MADLTIAIAAVVRGNTFGNVVLQPVAAEAACSPVVDVRDAQSYWAGTIGNNLRAQFAAGSSTVLRVNEFSWHTMEPAILGGYRGSFSTNSSELPGKETIRDALESRGPRIPYKLFKSKQATGEILISPMLKDDFVLDLAPAVSKFAVPEYEIPLTNLALDKDFWIRRPLQCPWSAGQSSWFDPKEEVFFAGEPLASQVHYQVFKNPVLYNPLTREQVYGWLSEIRQKVATLPTDDGIVAEARAEAQAGLLDLTTTIAELPETLKMIFEAIRILLAKYLEVRRKIDILRDNKVNQADLVSQISALWMQYRYGIMPNVYTIQDGLAYLDAQLVEYQSVRTGLEGVFELPPLEGFDTGSPMRMVERCFLKNRFDLSSLTKASGLLGRNPLTTAWELVPLSFVIDWVVNVGDFLASLSAPDGSVQEACQYSWQVSSGDFTLVHPEFLGANQGSFTFYRSEIIEPIDHTGLKLRFNLNLKRALDSLSLMWGATKRDYKRKLTTRIS